MQIGIERVTNRAMEEPVTRAEMSVALDGRGNQVVVRELAAVHHASTFTASELGDAEIYGERAILTLGVQMRERVAGHVLDFELPFKMYPPSHVESPPVRDVARATLVASVGGFSGTLPISVSVVRFVAAHAYLDETSR